MNDDSREPHDLQPKTDHDPPGSDGDARSIEAEPIEADPSPQPATFERQQLATAVRWVWFGGQLITVVILTLIVLQVDLFVLDLPGGLATVVTFVALIGFAVWRTMTRYRNWSWELTERELVIDRGVVFKLTRIVPRVRVQHVDISSGPLDRFFGLRQVSIYTAGTREADASIPGLTENRAEELRSALIGS